MSSPYTLQPPLPPVWVLHNTSVWLCNDLALPEASKHYMAFAYILKHRVCTAAIVSYHVYIMAGRKVYRTCPIKTALMWILPRILEMVVIKLLPQTIFTYNSS